jgi:hypothetical protein
VETCKKCGYAGVAPNSGVCLACGYKNKPQFDPAEEERIRKEKEKHETEQKKQEFLRTLAEIRKKIEECDFTGAGKMLKGISTKADSFNDPVLSVDLRKLEADLMKARGIDPKYYEILKKIISHLPFTEENYRYFYDLGVHYQTAGNFPAAAKIFEKFIEDYDIDFQDVTERYVATTGKGGSDTGYGDSGPTRVRKGAFEHTAESLREWIDRASRASRYFSDAVLLAEETDPIDDIRAKGIIAVDQVFERLHEKSVNSFLNLSANLETLNFSTREADAGDNVQCIVFRPSRPEPPMYRGVAGSIHVAVSLLQPDHVVAYTHVYFCPRAPEELEDLPARDFNDRVAEQMMQVSSMEKVHGLRDIVNTIKRNALDAVRRQITISNRGARSF